MLGLRDLHPAWGGRKLAHRLVVLGHTDVPSPSTITQILRRHGRLDPLEAARHKAWQRFARASPNELWQMDFKAPFETDQGRCHALTVIDDCSRFALGLEACVNQQGDTVQGRLTGLFRRYGLPQELLSDNGSPWGSSDEEEPRFTRLEAWLIQLGVELHHGRPYHPQTQGKDERFHRTLQAELIGRRRFRDLVECQGAFDRWRQIYNGERPHEALGLATPMQHYRPSPRSFPERLAAVEYPDRLVRKVQRGGHIDFGGRRWRGWARRLWAIRWRCGRRRRTGSTRCSSVSGGSRSCSCAIRHECDVSTMSPNRCSPCLRSIQGRAGWGGGATIVEVAPPPHPSRALARPCHPPLAGRDIGARATSYLYIEEYAGAPLRQA